MARDPEKRARSREMDKIRKRTQRAIARLQREESKVSGNYLLKRGLRQQIIELQQSLQQLTARGPRKTYTEKALVALETLKAGYVPAAKQRGPIDWNREFAKARGGKVSALGAQGKLKVKLFYYATQPLWELGDPEERNRLIIDALNRKLRSEGKAGISTLEQAYAYVMGSDPEIKRVLRDLADGEVGGPVADTDRGMGTAYYQAKRTRYQIDTPTAFIRVQQIEFAKAYGSM